MKKVGLVTIYDEDNYGNRLQNYAVQRIIEKLGFEVETIRNINIVDGVDYLEEAKKVVKERRDRFLDFNNNIKISEEVIYHDKIDEKFHEGYDYFIVGSDQVWNHSFPDRFSDFVFLDFAPEHKRIALSSSFGVDEISEDKIELYEKIAGIKNISVREDAGKKILEKQFNINNAVVLIDPTMMLDEDEWEEVMTKPQKCPDKKYILKYFLGPISSEKNKDIEKFAYENNLEIVDLLDKDNQYYHSGPGEFLYFIKNSDIVFADSFHSCVFSLLFNKNFLYFYRDGNLSNINSRLETLFNKFNVKDRFYNGKIDNLILRRKPEDIKEALDKEKEKMNDFLIKAFKLNE